MSALKIDSEVATDKDKEEFLGILRTGTVEKAQKSSYAANYRFFSNQDKDRFSLRVLRRLFMLNYIGFTNSRGQE